MIQTYVAFLRGINVSGSKKIKMAELREHLKELDLINIRTYIQSGNVIFEFNDGHTNALGNAIKEKISEKYSYDVPTLVKTIREITETVDFNPYKNDAEKDLNRVFITFLSDKPSKDSIDSVCSLAEAPEEIVFTDKAVYFYSPGNYARARLNNNFLESKLNVAATTRNLKTLNKILTL